MTSERDRGGASGIRFAPGANPWRKRAWLAVSLGVLIAAAWFALAPLQQAPRAQADAGEPRAERAAPEPEAPLSPPNASEGREEERGLAVEPDAEAPQQLLSETGSGDPVVASGIGLFPPPGTDPIKIGIVVPEDFPLPEGYLRHYQVTDDGQPMPAILLFHPDYALLDGSGNPIPLPADRVVPPEHAPPGLAIEMLVPPPPRDEAGAP